MTDSFNYAGLISRHIKSRLESFPPQLITQILEQSGLVMDGDQVRTKSREPLTDDASFKYKTAIRELLGKSAYEMTKMNFMMAGCRCQDCRGGL